LRILIDAMGGDHAPKEIVKGTVHAAQEWDHSFVLYGDEAAIKKELSNYQYPEERIDIVPTTEIVYNTDDPAKVIRRKKDSSMIRALKDLKEDSDAVLVSAGSTGALLAGGTLLIGRIPGIQRPALTVAFPKDKGMMLLLDVGANVDCKPLYLQQFALMASVYAGNTLGIDDPKVGLINIGTEENKGNSLVKETFPLLKESPVNFIGNVESRDLMESDADILVCDGFTGNIILKLVEGLSGYLFSSLKGSMTQNTKSKVGALLLKPALKEFKAKFDYNQYGGAPLLGIKSGVIKAHGSSNHVAFYHALRQAVLFHENKVIEKISDLTKKEKE